MKLAVAVNIYNSSVHSSTKNTPNLLWLGREIRFPLHCFLNFDGMPTAPSGEVKNYVTQLLRNQQKFHKMARINLKAAQRRQVAQYNRKIAGGYHFKKGDWVTILVKVIPRGNTSKLSYKRKGPFQIEKMSKANNWCFLTTGQRTNCERLAPWQFRSTDSHLSKQQDNLIPYLDCEVEEVDANLHSSEVSDEEDYTQIKVDGPFHMKLRERKQRVYEEESDDELEGET